jgi:hypothetical protein
VLIQNCGTLSQLPLCISLCPKIREKEEQTLRSDEKKTLHDLYKGGGCNQKRKSISAVQHHKKMSYFWTAVRRCIHLNELVDFPFAREKDATFLFIFSLFFI